MRKLHLPNIQREPRSFALKRQMLTILATMVIGALLFLATMVGGVWWRQERIAYQPPVDHQRSPSDVRKIDYVAADDQPLAGYLIEPAGEPAGVLIAFHGNADLATWQIPWGREVARRTGWCLFLAEYRGYGGLGGTPSYVGVREDARAAWRAVQRFAQEHPTIRDPKFALFGHSLGSGVASELAAELQSKAVTPCNSGTAREQALSVLVLQSPFTSARDMARIVSTRPVQVLWSLIARIHYDTRACFNEIDVPVSIAHGARDWLVPVSMGSELFSRAKMPGRLLIVDGAGHNDIAEIGGESYWQWLSDALSVRPVLRHEPQLTRRTEMLG